MNRKQAIKAHDNRYVARMAHDFVVERHQLRIAKETLKMNDAMVQVMGGMTKDEARRIIKNGLTEV